MNIMQTLCIKMLCTYIDRYNHCMNYMSSQSHVQTQIDSTITFYKKSESTYSHILVCGMGGKVSTPFLPYYDAIGARVMSSQFGHSTDRCFT